MHPQFGEWYQAVSLPQNGDTLKIRWAAADSFSITQTSAAQLAQVAFGNLSNEEFEIAFRDHMRAADASFRMKNNEAELSLLACAALVSLFRNPSDLPDEALTAAFAIKSASLSGLRSNKCLVADLLIEADKYLRKVTADRHNQPALDAATTPAEALPHIKTALALVSEEAQILWWLFGGVSRDTNEPFNTYTSKVLPFIAAQEISDLTTLYPAPVAIWGILNRAVSHAKDSAQVKKITITDAIAAAPEEFGSGLDLSRVDEFPDLTPLFSSIINYKNGGSDWEQRVLKALGLKKGASVSPTELAMHAFWECQFVSILD